MLDSNLDNAHSIFCIFTYRWLFVTILHFVFNQLTNIIWGETGESDDHIVPYPDESDGKPPASRGDSVKEEWDLEASNAKPGDQKKHAPKSGFDIKLESSSKHATDEALPALAFGKDSWPDLSLSNTTKMDQGSSCKETTNDVTEISKHEGATSFFSTANTSKFLYCFHFTLDAFSRWESWDGSTRNQF